MLVLSDKRGYHGDFKANTTRKQNKVHRMYLIGTRFVRGGGWSTALVGGENQNEITRVNDTACFDFVDACDDPIGFRQFDLLRRSSFEGFSTSIRIFHPRTETDFKIKQKLNQRKNPACSTSRSNALMLKESPRPGGLHTNEN